MIVEHFHSPPTSMGEIVRRSVLPSDSAPNAPINCRVLYLAPGARTTEHHHHDSEMWFIVSGQGLLSVDSTMQAVGPGDVIRLRPLVAHSIANGSPEDALIFLTIWWQDFHALKASHRAAACEVDVDQPVHLLLPAFPTPNGKLHLGHLGGPYVAADVLRRALRLLATPAYTLLGTLGHMNHVAVAAARRDEPYYTTAQYYTDSIKATLSALDIEWDAFVEPRPTAHYARLTHDIFGTLLKGGVIIEKDGLVHRRPSDGAILFEAQVSGTCPFCSADASANDCEACGRFHDDGQTVDGHCAATGEALELISMRRLYLRLETVRDALGEFRSQAVMCVEMRSFVDAVLSDSLPDVGITHVAEYGVSVPLIGYDRQRLNSYFEHAGRLLTAIQRLCGNDAAQDAWRSWLAQRPIKLVPIFGVDNCFMRGILFPALLAAYAKALIRPDTMITNKFMLLDGKKFSTSRQHAIWGDEFVKTKGVDVVRFFLAAIRPEAVESNFTLAAFDSTFSAVLRGLWQAWLSAVQQRLAGDFGFIVPEAGPWTDEARRFYGDLLDACDRVRRAYLPESFSTVRACAELNHFVELALRFDRATTVRHQLRSRETSTHMALQLMAVRAVALAASPVMPRFARGVLCVLGERGDPGDWAWPDPPTFVAHGLRVESLDRQWFQEPEQ
jgi:methionyl-tRNA synthetase